jgi:hypothetical protein
MSLSIDYSNKRFWYIPRPTVLGLETMTDKKDAPDGYRPVPKDSLVCDSRGNVSGNICNHCDWRKDCDAKKFSCMSYNRKDGIGVFFKKI